MFKAEKIRELCKEKGLTLSGLADKVGISNTGLHSIFKNNVTTIATLEKICNVLGVSPNYFFEYDEQTASSSDVHLNMGNGIIQHSAGNIRSNNKVVAYANSTESDELNSLKTENEHLKQKLVDKEAIIAMQNDFIQNLKRQIR